MADSSNPDSESSRTELSSANRTVCPGDLQLTETASVPESEPVDDGPFTELPLDFGRYHVLRELGRGQMGAVYLAQDTSLERLVALKVARSATAASVKLLKRMEIEAKSGARIDHPQICKVYDAGEIEGIQFIALQYVQGEDLEEYMQRKGRKRSPQEAIHLTIQLLQAVQTAHDKGIIHRDLKPENVMLNQNGEPVIMDFGLARTIVGSSDAGITQGMILGTAAYMSPEQAVGNAEQIDHRTDLYSLGVMLFEMLTGEWPFNGGAIEVMGKKCVQDSPSPLSFAPGLDPGLAMVCHKMIARQKEDRYASCSDAVEALEQVRQSLSESPEEPNRASEGVPSTHSITEEYRLSNQPTLITPASLAPAASGSVLKPDAVPILDSAIPEPRSAKSFFGWWNRKPKYGRWVIAAIVAGITLVSAMWFLPDSSGVVMIILDNPALSVQFQGSTITEDNDGEPIRVSSSTSNPIEVYHNGTLVDGATTQVELTKGERRRFKISFVDGQRIEIVSHSSMKEGSDADDPRRTIPLPQLSSPLTGMELLLIPAGEFEMGSLASETGHQPNEGPIRHVHVADPFYLGRFEVTQAEFAQVCGRNPSHFSPEETGRTRIAGEETARFPVEQVSWFSAIEFCNRLSQQERLRPYYRLSNLTYDDGFLESALVEILGGDGYRLPTEIEWEYACRAGSAEPFHYGNSSNGTQSNVNGRIPYGTTEAGPDLQRPRSVGAYAPNRFGLFDMHGNVAEWCEDLVGASSATEQPSSVRILITTKSAMRVSRGGAWVNDSTDARSARRQELPAEKTAESVGFRVARSLAISRP